MNSENPYRTENSRQLGVALAALFRDALTAAHWRTRFAPAPTGYLHIGHVVNAVYVWGIARAYGGQVVLRIEDHDRTRCRPEYEAALLDDLDWLGLQADVGRTPEFRGATNVLRQSDNLAAYQQCLRQLDAMGATYACRCSRKEIANQAGNSTGAEVRYPGTCRLLNLPDSDGVACRVRVTDGAQTFDDVRLGAQVQYPAAQCGDFVIRDRNGNFTYQLAVTVDDWQQGIDLVIRGEDLLSSTGRQLQLARQIGRTVPARFLHHPLVLREDGLKLSKSLGDTGIREMRAAGHSPRDVLGRAAFAGGLITHEMPLAVDDLPALFL